MIEVRNYITLPEVVPQAELKAWRDKIRSSEKDCPLEVTQFIEAIARKMSDFGQIGKWTTLITGYELRLSGYKEYNGGDINPWEVYPMPVPHMQAVDHRKWMYRIFRRRGKQGLIDYCRAQVKASDLEKTLSILNVQVFREDRPEFQKVMADIAASNKIESKFE
jgi:hypothetical protein